MVTNLRAKERHLPYGITVTFSPPTDIGERAPSARLDLLTPNGW